MNAAALAQAIDGRSRELFAGLAVELRSNLGTSHYRRLREEEVFHRVSVVFQHLGQWLVSGDEAALRKDGEELGRKRFAEGVPLGQVVLALILNEKHLWQLLDFAALHVNDDARKAVTDFFQRHTYYTARGYEEALAKSNRHAQCAAADYPAPSASPLKPPSKKEPGKEESDLEISREGKLESSEAEALLPAASSALHFPSRMSSESDPLVALRRYWGYDSFRPLQESIVRSLLEGCDACVVMPTGGGKSLCYQLPAALLSRQTVLVISPLIALMQDQVAQLAQMGIPSAALNSALAGDRQSAVMRSASEGAYRLLYISPERLARADTIEWLQSVPISFFAIDEAHCISEWGHEFRPEYRQLSCLRLHFPDRSIAAFTASATRRVRHDIIDQLQLRDPRKYIASFHRRNLRYIVKECAGGAQSALLVTALRRYSEGNIIVYAPTILRVEETVDFLEERGIPAIAYHGKMDADSRKTNQERWMSDEVRVLVGTIAFGLGINKAAVRAVIHLSLPQSIEQYYQEAGRAGRDGYPADCLLLWQKRDAGLLAYFVEKVTDPAERERAWQRYREIRGFVESKRCRHRQICTHFGEDPKWTSCQACDICGGAPEWLSQAAQMEPPKRAQSIAPAPPPVRASKSEPQHNKRSVTDAEPELREYLREWRRETAKRQRVPAYVVMHDTSLEELCRIRPGSLAELRSVYGFGERKTESYGRQILEALQRFRGGARAAATPEKKPKPADETIRLIAEGRSFEEIARIRGRQLRSVIDLVADLVERGDLQFQPGWVDFEKQVSIEAACARLGLERIKTLKDALPPEITFEEIRLVVARVASRLRRQEGDMK